MATIDNTVYPTFSKEYSEWQLQELFSPSKEEMSFVNAQTRGDMTRTLMILLLKCHQHLGYFPDLKLIPKAIVRHIADVMQNHSFDSQARELARSASRFRGVIRKYLGLKAYSHQGQQVVEGLLQKLAYHMNAPNDLINAAIEELIRNNYSLPGFYTLSRLVRATRQKVHAELFDRVETRLPESVKQELEGLLSVPLGEHRTPFASMKEHPGYPSLTQMKNWRDRYEWLNSLLDTRKVLKGIPLTKIEQFAAEAHAFEVSDIQAIKASGQRYTLLACLIHIMKMRTRDELVVMLVKRTRKTQKKAKEKLEQIKAEHRKMEEELLGILSKVMDCVEDSANAEQVGLGVIGLLEQYGGAARLSAKTKMVSQYHGDNFLPLLWPIHASHRKAMFEVADILKFSSASRDDDLIIAWERFRPYRSRYKQVIEDQDFPLSFASNKWRSQIIKETDGKRGYDRRLLESCLFHYLVEGLQSTDIFISESLQFGDYREQLLPIEECRQRMDQYCLEAGLPNSAAKAVSVLKAELESTAHELDRSYPENKGFSIGTNGRPQLKKDKKGKPSPTVKELKAIIASRMPEYGLLDVLNRVDCWTDYTSQFGPISGSMPKIANARENYILTLFAYGSNIGPVQAERHINHPITRRVISKLNAQHIDAQKIQRAMADIIDPFSTFELASLWGDPSRAVADGTHVELTENNLLGERHVRYGGYGGIAYHHISDTYIALFSHFITCGVWEAVYILDGLMKQSSSLKPDKVNADTQGQNEPAFGLSYLLGIELMPRIRNWKRLNLYKPHESILYKHIDALFKEVIDWGLIERHWEDMMQVVISIQAGQVLPSFILQKLGANGRQTKLYKAFRELGRVKRTIFLLKYIQDTEFRKDITKATTKIESYNSFCDWITFGGQTIMTGDPVEQEKRVKYTSLMANAIMLNNIVDLTKIIRDLRQEGYQISDEDLAHLSPYITFHIRRFGEYFLNSDNVPPPIVVKFLN